MSLVARSRPRSRSRSGLAAVLLALVAIVGLVGGTAAPASAVAAPSGWAPTATGTIDAFTKCNGTVQVTPGLYRQLCVRLTRWRGGTRGLIVLGQWQQNTIGWQAFAIFTTTGTQAHTVRVPDSTLVMRVNDFAYQSYLYTECRANQLFDGGGDCGPAPVDQGYRGLPFPSRGCTTSQRVASGESWRCALTNEVYTSNDVYSTAYAVIGLEHDGISDGNVQVGPFSELSYGYPLVPVF